MCIYRAPVQTQWRFVHDWFTGTLWLSVAMAQLAGTLWYCGLTLVVTDDQSSVGVSPNERSGIEVLSRGKAVQVDPGLTLG